MLKKCINNIVNKLSNAPSNKAVLSDLMSIVSIDSYELALDFLNSNGLDICIQDDMLHLKTTQKVIKNELFCFVDIETNGPKAEDSQIIEIGAVLVKNFSVVQTFQTLIKCDEVSEHIVEITGLTPAILKDGMCEAKALANFKNMLGNAVFVAHNVGFDFSFIAKRMEKLGIGYMFNRKLCTVELAKRTLYAQKYGLKCLSETFNLPSLGSHRALPDALASKDIFELSLKSINDDDMIVEKLIKFSEQAPLFRRSDES